MALVEEKAKGKRQKAKYGTRLFPSLFPSAFCLLPSIILFLSLSLHQLDLPGLYYDEGFDLTPMLSVMHGEPVELLRGVGVSLFGRTYPVMRMDYMGSLNGYLTLPFMAVLGPGYLASRLEPLVFSLITLVLAWVLARRWFGDKVAAITALLLSVSPSFIWFTRQGITVTSVMTVFALGSWIVLDVWRRRTGDGAAQKPRRSTTDGKSVSHLPSAVLLPLLAGLLLGLGLWAKIVFVWWLVLTVVVGGVWLVSRWRTWRRDGGRETGDGASRLPSRLLSRSVSRLFLPALFLFLGFLIGAAPFIYYNLAGLAQGQPPATFNLLFRALLNPTEYAVSNSNFWANLDKRFQDFAVFLNGSYFWYLANVPYGNVFAVPTFVGSVLIGAALVWPRARERGKWLAVLLCVAIYLPMSSFTVSDLWATHFFMLLPLPQMLMACAAVWLGEAVVSGVTRLIERSQAQRPDMQRWLQPVASFGIAALLLAPAFSRDVWVNQQYHAALAQTGGAGRFSDAVYKLAAQLEQNQVAEPIALDWGISQQIRVLTGDRVRPREVFGFTPEPTDEFRQQVRDLLQDSSRQYVVLWAGDANFAGFAVYNRRSEFTQIANAMGKQVVETFIAHERSGLPVYVILQAR